VNPSPTRAAPLPPEERRAAIIEAAIPLVCNHGAAVTTKEIAEAAGIAEGTIFRVFPDKEALITAVVNTVLDPSPLVRELQRIDPTESLERVVSDAVDALRRRIESVWQIMWMLRVSGPPENDQNTSKFVVVRSSGVPGVTPPDMTEAIGALAELLIPHRHELRLPPVEAARMFRLVTFASAHPRIADGQPLSTPEIVDLLLHGIGATTPPSEAAAAPAATSAQKATVGPSGQTTDSIPEPGLSVADSQPVAHPVGAR
jgi:AcrR family transcriptional regulator